MEVLKILTDYYTNYDEENRLLSKHGMVEYLTTMRYIEKYLQPGMRILEVGAATGRYSHTLAQKGFRVDAVELVQHNIEIFKQKTLPGENVTIRQGDARDLSYYTRDALNQVAADVAYFARAEGLTAHARSAVIRGEDDQL